MKKFLSETFCRPITREQCKDTGMAMVLLLLLFGFVFFKRDILVGASVVVLLIDMIYPPVFKPVAVVWLGLSHLLGTVMSKIILTLIFFLVVTPIGLLRRIMGKDSLRLKGFKSGTGSVMAVRNHTFTAADIVHPY